MVEDGKARLKPKCSAHSPRLSGSTDEGLGFRVSGLGFKV